MNANDGEKEQNAKVSKELKEERKQKEKALAEAVKLEKVLENPSVIKTPVVRNGKQSTLGYQPDVWKKWE